METSKHKITKEEAIRFFRQLIEDKHTIQECIRQGGDVDKRLDEKGIFRAAPLFHSA